MEKLILHCDLNNFYASVECVLDSNLKNKPVAVAGSTEKRQGIILSKNYEAKRFGVLSAEPLWQTLKKCPNLVVVPPKFEEYKKYSNSVFTIYKKYTDIIEPFGIDECWLDMTGTEHIFGNSLEIANKIKEDVKNSTGLTISIGVSFNKVFAKLGSDMKKPDAITEITKQNFKEKIWNLDVGNLFGVGPNTKHRLSYYRISTIGDLANANVNFLLKTFGKTGYQIWANANGIGSSDVDAKSYLAPPKSIGNGKTLEYDIKTKEEVWKNIFHLSNNIEIRLRKKDIFANSVQISIKDNKFNTKSFKEKLKHKTRNSYEIAKKAMDLFSRNHIMLNPIRAITITVNIEQDSYANQISFFDTNYENECAKIDKYEKVGKVMQNIRNKFGNEYISYATIMQNRKSTKI